MNNAEVARREGSPKFKPGDKVTLSDLSLDEVLAVTRCDPDSPSFFAEGVRGWLLKQFYRLATPAEIAADQERREKVERERAKAERAKAALRDSLVEAILEDAGLASETGHTSAVNAFHATLDKFEAAVRNGEI